MWKFTIIHRLIQDFRLLLSLIKDYWSGRYRKIPYVSAAVILFAILYFVYPFDLLPDYLLGLGQIDDVIVFGLCLFLVERDLYKYKEWKMKGIS
jgi:uncharacterized membrane protein YkvA (DUF1232 family)